MPDDARPSADSPDLNELLFEWFERSGADERALDELCARHPDRADGLRKRIVILRDMGLLETGGADPTPSEHDLPDRLGDFRLIEVIGRGGMGVVYRARQESLGREVALKLVRPDQLYFEGARERFQREVRTIALLNHPGIVPIYSVGEENGVPYFAMECVDGCTLGDVLRRLADRSPADLDGPDIDRAIAAQLGDEPSGEVSPLFQGGWTTVCLRIVREVAEALEHAHRRGVLHRDLKPSNIMVTRSGRVMLLDFGLSSARGGGGDRITKTGSRPGSLLYMPPELLRGSATDLDWRSDVYSLSAALYELLTLRPPFLAESEVELIQRIVAGGAAPVRSINPRVSWDAETVCLTGMDPDPGRRYETVSDLARDLDNVLHARPIEARRTGFVLRARRWAQRHPAWAVGVVLGGALVVGGPALYGWQQHRANVRIQAKNEEIRTANDELSRAVADAHRQRERAVDEQVRAELNFRKALSAVDFMLTRVGHEELEHVPAVQDVRRELLEEALTFYEGFLEERLESPGLRAQHARALRHVGQICLELSRFDRAEEALVESAALHRELFAESGDRVQATALSESLLRLGTTYFYVSRSAEAERTYRAGIEFSEPLAGDDVAPDELHLHLARHHTQLALLLRELGRWDEAEPHIEHVLAQEWLAEAVAVEPLESDRSQQAADTLAAVHDAVGAVRRDQRRFDESLVHYGEALRLRQALHVALPDSSTTVENLARAHLNLGTPLHDLGRHTESVGAFRTAMEMYQRLADDFPNVVGYRELVAQAASNYAVGLQTSVGPTAEAEEAMRSALDARRWLLARDPANPTLRLTVGTSLQSLASFVRDKGELAEARRLVEESVACLTPLAEQAPDHRPYREQLSYAWLVAADIDLARGQHAGVVQACRDAAEALPTDWVALRRASGRVAMAATLAQQDGALDDAARAATVAGYVDASLEMLRRSIEHGYREVDDMRTAMSFMPLRERDEFHRMLADLEASVN